MNDEPLTQASSLAESLIRTLDAQNNVNASITRALESLSLQADKYDSVLAHHRDRIGRLEREVDDLCTLVSRLERGDNRMHSVRVDE